MADLLEDDWWQEDKKLSQKKINKNSKVNPQKRLKSLQSEHVDLDSVSEQGKLGKRKKKNKTEELKKKPDVPAKAEDLFNMIKSVTDSLQTIVEKEQLQFENGILRVRVCCHCFEKKRIWQDLRVASSADSKSSSLDNLEKMIPDAYGVLVKKKLPDPGAPRLIILTGGALRVITLRKLMLSLAGPDCKVAKLFAKHMKVKEQCAYLSKSTIHVAVGTPKRVSELVDLDALKLNRLRYLVIDWNYRDKKLQRMVDLNQVKIDLVDTLLKHFIPVILENNAKILLL